MAEVKLQIPFDAIHGAIEKHGIISRQKKYRDEKPTPRLHPCHALSNPQN